MRSSHETREPEEATATLPFALELSGRGGKLSLQQITSSPLVEVRRLTINLPHLAHPVDLSHGAGAFCHHRGRLGRFDLALDGATLQTELRARLAASPSPSVALHEIRLEVAEAELILAARVTSGEHQARCVWRARIIPAGDAGADALLVSIFEIRVIGWLPLPGLALCPLLFEALPPQCVRRQGISHAVLGLIRPLLKQILVTRGWKVPAHGAAVATHAFTESDTLRVCFDGSDAATPEVIASGDLPDARTRRLHEDFVRDLELKRHHARLDQLIAEGAHLEAVRECQRRLRSGEARDFLERRLLELLRCSEVNFESARALVERRLASAPNDTSALLAAAAMAEHDGDKTEAVKLLDQLAHQLDPARNGLTLEQCRLHQATLLTQENPAAAERVLGALLRDLPDSGPGLAALARLMHSRGAHDEASQLRARLLAAEVDEAVRVEAALAVADYHLSGGRPDKARPFLDYLHSARRASPKADLDEAASDHLAARLIELEEACGNPKIAVAVAREHLERAASPETIRSTALVLATLLETRLDSPAEAALVVERAIAAVGRSTALLHRSAELWRVAGRHDLALTAGRAALAALEDDATDEPRLRAAVHTEIGLALFSVKEDFGAARLHFERALDSAPSHQPALEGLESVTRAPDDWDALVARLHRALEHTDAPQTGALLALRLALIYSRTFGFADDALPLLERALNGRPGDSFALRHLVELTRQVGDWRRHRDALETLLAGCRERDERARVLAELAEVEAERLANPERAREHLEELLCERPRDRRALSRLALLLGRLGDSRALVPVLRRQAALAESARRRQEILMDLAELQLDALNQVDEAEATLDGEQWGQSRRLDWLRGRLRALSNPAPARAQAIPEGHPARPPAAESGGGGTKAWHQALKLADEGDHKEALDLLHELVEREPDHRPTWELLGAIYHITGDSHGSAAVAAALSELDARVRPPDPQPLSTSAPRAAGEPALSPGEATSATVEHKLASAKAALDAGDAPEARRLAEEALALDPDCVVALDLLIPLLRQTGDERQAATLLGRRAELTWDAREAPIIALRAAQALESVGRRELAGRFYRRYLRWTPLDDEVFERLACELRERGERAELADLLDERIEALRRLRTDGGDESIGVTLSLMLTERAAILQDSQGEPERAIKLLEQARRDWPQNGEALERLAELLEQTERWGELAAVLEALLGTTEDRALRAKRLGRLVALYRETLQDPVAARETLRVALRELPSAEARALRRALEGE